MIGSNPYLTTGYRQWTQLGCLVGMTWYIGSIRVKWQRVYAMGKSDDRQMNAPKVYHLTTIYLGKCGSICDHVCRFNTVKELSHARVHDVPQVPSPEHKPRARVSQMEELVLLPFD